MPKSDISHLPRRTFFADMPAPVAVTVRVLKTKSERVAVAEAMVARVTKPQVAKRSRGRPRAEGVRPWEAEGLSRAQWYRREAAKKEKTKCK